MQALEDGHVTPVVRPEEVWHLARLSRVRDLIRLFETQGNSRANGSSHPTVPPSREMLEELARADWLNYVDLVAITPAERAAMLSLGEPASISLSQEERTPVAIWNHNQPPALQLFGESLVPADESSGAASYPISDPFKPVDLDTMPPLTFKVRLTDTRHTSTAAVHEFASLLLRDLQRIRLSEPGDVAWRTFRRHAKWLRQCAETSLSYLGHDHYQGWDSRLPDIHALHQATAVIDQHAATTTAQQRLALHYTADSLEKMLTSAETQYSRDIERRLDAVVDLVRENFELIDREFETFNASVVHAAGLVRDEVVTFVVFRPKGILHPMFVAIPLSEVPEIGQIPAKSP